MKIEFTGEEIKEIEEMADRNGLSVEQFAKEAVLDRIRDIYEEEKIVERRKEFMRKSETDGNSDW